jgi:hypothetical protein
MSSDDLNNLRLWLTKKYPKETLKMWIFETLQNNYEYYISTDSK